MKRRVGRPERIWRGVWALAAVCGLALAGCGSSKADSGEPRRRTGDASGKTSSTIAASAKGEDAPGRPGSGGRTTPTSVDSGSAAAHGGDKAAGDEPKSEPVTRTMQISMELKQPCVRPGESQTITIHAPYTSSVGYNTYYADGKSGLSEGFYGGNMVGFTDQSDTWTHTWVVAVNAPAGEAVVVVLATHDEQGRGETGDLFTVADALGRCP